MRNVPIPPPEARVPVALYLETRDWLLNHDPDAGRLVEWATKEAGPPSSPEHSAREIVWIILCAGRKAQAARTLEKRVWEAIREGRPVMDAFAYRAKASAIERAWQERAKDFAELQAVLSAGSPEKVVEWCRSIPFVGATTAFQLAKNFGSNTCKPDIWMCRLAGIPDRPQLSVDVRYPACMALCRHLEQGSGDRVAVIDSLLWLACNKGVLSVSDRAGPVLFNRQRSAARSIMMPADDCDQAWQ